MRHPYPGLLAAVLLGVTATANAAPKPWIAMCEPPGARASNLDVDLYRIDSLGRSEALTTGASVADLAAGGGAVAFEVPRFQDGFVTNALRLRRAGSESQLSLPRFQSARAMRGNGRVLAFSARRADDRGTDLLTVRIDRQGARPTRVTRETGPGIWSADFDASGALWATEPRSKGRATIVRKLTGRKASFTDRTRPNSIAVGDRLLALGTENRVLIRTRTGRYVAQLKNARLETWSQNDRTVLVRLDNGKTIAEWTPATGRLERWAPTPCGVAFRLQPTQ